MQSKKEVDTEGLFKAGLLLGIFSIFSIQLGEFIAGSAGFLTGIIISSVVNAAVYLFGDRWILLIYRAQRLSAQEVPELFEILNKICSRANLPLPKLYFMATASPNAFAIGVTPEQSSIVVTQGMVELLNREELEGVFAYHLAQIERRSTFPGVVAAVFASGLMNIVTLFRWMFLVGAGTSQKQEESQNPLVMLVASAIIPFSALIVRSAISPAREWKADEASARITQNSLYLASALRKVDVLAKQRPLLQAQPASAHLFMINPLIPGRYHDLFKTHTSIEDRIVRLEKLADF